MAKIPAGWPEIPNSSLKDSPHPWQPHGVLKPWGAPGESITTLEMGTDFRRWNQALLKLPGHWAGLCTEPQDWDRGPSLSALFKTTQTERWAHSSSRTPQPGPFWALQWDHLAVHQLRLWFVLFLHRGREPDLRINLPLPNFSVCLFRWAIRPSCQCFLCCLNSILAFCYLKFIVPPALP